jgi:putative photosynthetic complex assembly protein
MAHSSYIPKGTLPLVGALVSFCLVVVTVAVLMEGNPAEPPVPENATQVALLTFEDGPDGTIIVRNGAGEQQVLPSDYNGFVRGVLRALARERRKVGVGPEPPFALTRDAAGNFYFGDPNTGERIDLRAFGRDNASAFVALMPEPAETASVTPVGSQ